MAYRPYGNMSPVWSAEEYTPWEPPENQIRNLAVSAALGAGAFAGLVSTKVGTVSHGASAGQSLRAIDLVQAHWRAFSESTPFALLNTFRVSEFLSPFTSGVAKSLATGSSVIDSTRNVAFYEYGAEFLGNDETRDYLKTIISKEKFEKAGLNLPGDIELRDEQDLDGNKGRLLSRRLQPELAGSASVKTPWSVLGNVRLMEAAPFQSNYGKGKDAIKQVSTHKTINPAFQAVLQALGITESFGDGYKVKSERLFSAADATTGKFKYRKAYIPIPVDETRTLGRLGLLGTYSTVPLAFGMERTNRLLQQTIEQVPFLHNTTQFLEDRLGIKAGVQSGKPLNMFMRYGGKAAKIGGAYLALEQVDWIRRNYSLPGEMIASGAVSVGAAYLFNKVKKFLIHH